MSIGCTDTTIRPAVPKVKATIDLDLLNNCVNLLKDVDEELYRQIMYEKDDMVEINLIYLNSLSKQCAELINKLNCSLIHV